MQKDNSNNMGIPIAIIVAGMLLSAGLYFGLQSSNNSSGTDTNNQPTTAKAMPTEAPSIVDVSMDDDAIEGDANAPVTIIEFSDYECPYCKRYVQQTYPEIFKNYIDTGKVKYIFRDLPLSFHDPAATKEAIAANCARAQGDDKTYYKFHDLQYENTGSNGTGIPDDKLVELAKSLGLDGAKFKKCVDDEEYKDEVTKDLDDAQKVGATGTPTFFIGKSSDSGTIKGEMLVGAQPYEAFKAAIEKYLPK